MDIVLSRKGAKYAVFQIYDVQRVFKTKNLFKWIYYRPMNFWKLLAVVLDSAETEIVVVGYYGWSCHLHKEKENTRSMAASNLPRFDMCQHTKELGENLLEEFHETINLKQF